MQTCLTDRQVYRKSIYFVRIFADIIVIIAAFIISANLSYPEFNFYANDNSQFLLLVILLIWLFSTKSTGLYDEFRSRNISLEIITVIKNILAVLISSMITLFLLKEYRLSRVFIIAFSISLLVLLSIDKILFKYILNVIRIKGRNLRNLLIVGVGQVGESGNCRIYKTIKENPHFGYRIMGFLDDKIRLSLSRQQVGL